MIEHIVLFRWKTDATQEQIADVMTALTGLKDIVPGIISLSCGADFSGRSRGYSHGLVVRFTDEDALRAYSPHPAHRKVVDELIKPIIEETLGFDFAIR